MIRKPIRPSRNVSDFILWVSRIIYVIADPSLLMIKFTQNCERREDHRITPAAACTVHRLPERLRDPVHLICTRVQCLTALCAVLCCWLLATGCARCCACCCARCCATHGICTSTNHQHTTCYCKTTSGRCRQEQFEQYTIHDAPWRLHTVLCTLNVQCT